MTATLLPTMRKNIYYHDKIIGILLDRSWSYDAVKNHHIGRRNAYGACN